MRTTERLRALKTWAQENLCSGREMKVPVIGRDGHIDLTETRYDEPHVFIGWQPTRPDTTGYLSPDPANVCPSITIMPSISSAKYVEEKRFDRYNNVHRSQDLGQELAVTILFSVFEPGTRLPGFTETMDPQLLMEGTEQGLFTLFNWMDDCKELLLSHSFIPNSDLFVQEASIVYSLHTDQNYITDKRPLYYGYINVKFSCYADDGGNRDIEALLN